MDKIANCPRQLDFCPAAGFLRCRLYFIPYEFNPAHNWPKQCCTTLGIKAWEDFHCALDVQWLLSSLVWSL
jgi:hypothetical protein